MYGRNLVILFINILLGPCDVTKPKMTAPSLALKFTTIQQYVIFLLLLLYHIGL